MNEEMARAVKSLCEEIKSHIELGDMRNLDDRDLALHMHYITGIAMGSVQFGNSAENTVLYILDALAQVSKGISRKAQL